MRIILIPHIDSYFGQDFTSNFLVKKMGLYPIYLREGKYDTTGIDTSRVRMMISRNGDRSDDQRLIAMFSGRIPVILHIHLKFSFLSVSQKQCLIKSMDMATALVTNCQSLAQEYQQLFPSYNWNYVNNGVDATTFYPASLEERTDFRTAHNISASKILLSYTGRLNNAKGVQVLEQLVGQVTLKEQFVIFIQTIYHPKYEAILKKLAKLSTEIKIITAQQQRIVRFCDFHILTSLVETTSLVTLEALFSGVPAICADAADFFEELGRHNLPFDFFWKIPFDRYAFGHFDEKYRIGLNADQVRRLSVKFMDVFDKLKPLSESQRAALGLSFAKSNYNADTMICALNKLYDVIEMNQFVRNSPI
ncbi:MAG: hypothetical protein JO149_02775, partial [Gammaproteobacteria bacterium]|nr:hypothetical protein [Gammaproteobacteria bacterium]